MPRLNFKAPRISVEKFFEDCSDPEDKISKDANERKSICLASPSHSGEVFAFGDLTSNSVGVLGDIECKEPHYPTPIPCLVGKKFSAVACGLSHNLLLTINGEVLSFGDNSHGQLGRRNDGVADKSRPALVSGISERVVQICAGKYFSVVLTETGNVFFWGAFRTTEGGKLLGSIITYPKLISSYKVMKIAAGFNHFIMLTVDNNVYSWGDNVCMQIGRSHVEELKRLERKQEKVCLRRRADAEKVLTEFHTIPIRVHFDNCYSSRISNVFCSAYASFFVACGGRVYVCGNNEDGMLGVDLKDGEIDCIAEPTESALFGQYRWENITGGLNFIIGLTTNGKVFTVGKISDSHHGAGLRNPNIRSLKQVLESQKCSFVWAGLYASFAINAKGQLFAWGRGSLTVPARRNIVDTPVLCQKAPNCSLDLHVVAVSAIYGHVLLIVDGNLDLNRIFKETLRTDASSYKFRDKVMSKRNMFQSIRICRVKVGFGVGKVNRDAFFLLRHIVQSQTDLSFAKKKNIIAILETQLAPIFFGMPHIGTLEESIDLLLTSDKSNSFEAEDFSEVMEDTSTSSAVLSSVEQSYATEWNDMSLISSPSQYSERSPYCNLSEVSLENPETMEAQVTSDHFEYDTGEEKCIIFYGTGSLYLFVRYYSLLCDRLSKVFEASQKKLNQSNSAASFFIEQNGIDTRKWYEALLDVTKSSFASAKKRKTFDEQLQDIFGASQSLALNVDNILERVMRYLKNAVSDDWDSFVELHLRYTTEETTLQASDEVEEYKAKAGELVENELFLFRIFQNTNKIEIDWVPVSKCPSRKTRFGNP